MKPIETMVEKTQPDDGSRRTFLKSLGVTGAATAGLGSLSDTAAAKSTSTSTTTTTKNSMKKLDIKVDDIVPENKHLSITIKNVETNTIKEMDVQVGDTSVSKVQQFGANTVVLSVFDILTNTNLTSQESVPVKVQGITETGAKIVGSDVVNVVDPSNVLSGTTGTVTNTVDSTGTVGDTTETVTGTVDSTGTVGDTTETVTGTVDSLGVLSESSSNRQQQMY